MKTLYIVTSQYMPLIKVDDVANPSAITMRTGKLIRAQVITAAHLYETLEKSKNSILAFESKEDAQKVMGLALRGHNTDPNFIDGKIPFFAVPVVFGVQIADENLPQQAYNLTGATLAAYFETDSIPLSAGLEKSNFLKEILVQCLDDKIKKLSGEIRHYRIAKSAIINTLDANYLAINPLQEKEVVLSEQIENANTSSCSIS